jgi:hypothetical protein
MLVNYEKFMRPDRPEHNVFLVTLHEKFISHITNALLMLYYAYKKLKRNTVQVLNLALWWKFMMYKDSLQNCVFYKFINILTSNIGYKLHYKT